MQELLETLRVQFESMMVDAKKASDGNVAAGRRARKNAMEITRLCKSLRAEIIESVYKK